MSTLWLIVFLLLAVLIVFLSVRKFFLWSDKFRAKYYHKLTDEEIEQIVKEPQHCWLTIGVSFKTQGQGTIQIKDGEIYIRLENGEEIKIHPKTIKKVETNAIMLLAIYPNSLKKWAISNDGRYGIYFGKSLLRRQLFYEFKNLPFPWYPKAKEDISADKKALAFFYKIRALKKIEEK